MREHFSSRLYWFVLLLILTCLNVACSDRNPNQKTVVGSGSGKGTGHRLVTKMEYQKIQKGNWTGEVWVESTLYPLGQTFGITHRLTAPDKTKELPKVVLELELVAEKDGKPVRSATIQPEFKECATIEEHEELLEEGDGNPTPFPQKEGVWQATVPFSTMTPNQPFEPGRYWIKVRTNIENGPSLSFTGIWLTFKKNPKSGH
jgi:hypothetical protein